MNPAQWKWYVRPFRLPPKGNGWVSNGGGAQVRWRPDGKELFYIAPGGTLMAEDVHVTGSSFEVGAPKVFVPYRDFVVGRAGGPTNAWRYAISAKDAALP